MGTGPGYPVAPVVQLLHGGCGVQVLHGAEVFGSDSLEGGRPEVSLQEGGEGDNGGGGMA